MIANKNKPKRMLCPYCKKNMESGYIQSGNMIIWTTKKHRFSLTPKNNDILLSKSPWGGSVVLSYHCPSCSIIITSTEKGAE